MVQRKPTRAQREFAARLRAVRITAGFETADAFAEVLGIEAARYRRWERAEVEPNIESFQQIANITGYSLDWLIAGHGERIRRPVPAGK